MSAVSYPSSPNHRAPRRAATSTSSSSSRRQVYASPVLASSSQPLSFSPKISQQPLSYFRPRTFTASEVQRQQEVVVLEPPPSPPRVRQRSPSTTTTTTTRTRASSPPPLPPPPPPPPPLPFKQAGLGVSSSNGSSSESSFETARSFQSPRRAPLPPPHFPSNAVKRRLGSNSYASPALPPSSNDYDLPLEAVPPLSTPSPVLRQE